MAGNEGGDGASYVEFGQTTRTWSLNNEIALLVGVLVILSWVFWSSKLLVGGELWAVLAIVWAVSGWLTWTRGIETITVEPDGLIVSSRTKSRHVLWHKIHLIELNERYAVFDVALSPITLSRSGVDGQIGDVILAHIAGPDGQPRMSGYRDAQILEDVLGSR